MVTVRKLKPRVYGVGQLKDKKWTLLRIPSLGNVPPLQLVYPNKKIALATAKFLNRKEVEKKD